MDATVVICTRNRARSLERTLRSIAEAAKHVQRPWELLIVDNGSTDDTRAAAEAFGAVLPVRVVLETNPGLSNARNAGVAHARGRYIVWTDDDVTVDEMWLASYLDAFDAYPDAAIFGGTAMPLYDAPMRSWVIARERDLGSLLAIRNSPEWEEIGPDRVPFGLNYAVRTAEQRQHLYDPELGVAPGRRRGGEETAMMRSLLAAGGTGRWVWASRVNHLIPADRQSARYVFQYYRAFGYNFPDVPADAGPLPPRVARVGARLVRKGLMTLARRAIGSDGWVPSYVDFARSIGTIDRLRGRKL